MGVETALIAAAAVSTAGTVVDGLGDYSAAKRQQKLAHEQSKALKLQRARDLADLEKQRGASAASLRAVMAATGQLNTASTDALVSTDAANFGVSKSRLLQDYEIEGGFMRAREDEFGRQATGSLVKTGLGVAGAAARGYASVLSVGNGR